MTRDDAGARHVLHAPLARAVFAMLLVIALGCVFHGRGTFFALDTHLATLRASSSIGLLAIGMTLVVLAAGIDLSVGSVLGLGAMVFAGLSLAVDTSPAVAVAAAIGAGAGVGLVNGTLCARFGLQPFVATLATMVAVRGLAKLVPTGFGAVASTKIMPPADAIDGTPLMQGLAGDVLGIPVVGVLFLVVSATTTWLLRVTVVGRHLYAVGGNEDAARHSGIAIGRVKLAAYTTCGALAGLAGVVHAAQSRLGDPEAGTMFELKAIAAVVIGGTLLTGGRGGVPLTVVGVLTIGYIEKVLSINGIREHWRLLLQGAIIVAAVLLQRRSSP